MKIRLRKAREQATLARRQVRQEQAAAYDPLGNIERNKKVAAKLAADARARQR